MNVLDKKLSVKIRCEISQKTHIDPSIIQNEAQRAYKYLSIDGTAIRMQITQISITKRWGRLTSILKIRFSFDDANYP